MKKIDIPDLEHYSSMITGFIELNGVEFNKYGLVQSSNRDAISAVAWDDKKFCLMPGPEFSRFLFRGENKEFYNSRASLYRVKSNIERIFWILKTQELEYYIDQLPGIEWLKEWRVFDREFLFDHESIAQHYGGKTKIMDFSRSEDVAMFFATTKYDGKTRKYVPLTSGEGVLYRLDLSGYLRSGNRIMPLGFHFFPRPSSQKAFGLHLSEKDDIASGKIKYITKNIFSRNKKISYKYFEMFEEGNLIYPKSPFDEFFEYFMGNRKVRLRSVVNFLARDDKSYLALSDIEKCFNDLGFLIEKGPLECPSEEMKIISANLREGICNYLKKNLNWRMVSPPFQG